MNLWKVYALYLSLDGKTDVKNYDSFSKVTLYGWIYEVLSNANAGDNVAWIYLSNIWEELRKDKGSFNEDDKNLALVMAKRIGKPLDNAFNKKISSIDGFVISQISDMLISFKVPKDWAEEVARVIQIGGSVWLFLLIKNPYFRIALAWLTLPFIYTLVTKWVYVHLDQTVQAEIEAMVKKNAGYMTPPGENKEYYIDKVETLLAIKEDPEWEFERQKEKSFYKIEWDSMTKISWLDWNSIIAEVWIEGLIIHYNGQKYELKLWPWIDVWVTFRRQKINFKEIKIEQDKFIIWDNAYDLPVNKVSEIMWKSAQKLWKDSSGGLYYILEEWEPYLPSLAKNSWWEEIFEGISEKINEGHLIVQRIN